MGGGQRFGWDAYRKIRIIFSVFKNFLKITRIEPQFDQISTTIVNIKNFKFLTDLFMTAAYILIAFISPMQITTILSIYFFTILTQTFLIQN